MITNEQRAHDIALTLLQSRAKDLKPIEAYHEYVNSLLPILKEIDRIFPTVLKSTFNFPGNYDKRSCDIS